MIRVYDFPFGTVSSYFQGQPFFSFREGIVEIIFENPDLGCDSSHVFHHVGCDGCGMWPIRGMAYEVGCRFFMQLQNARSA